MSATADRSLIAACRAARRVLSANKWTIVESVSYPPGSRSIKSVRDPAALAWIEEHDAAIRKIDAAIGLATVRRSCV